mmetsp:Transcript_32569/g.70332  ORF Transcript_32569/g.70332 Transcript_32569/m.70332 type:complete len:279 (+) Transcript_32569:620-1456(+)
MIFFLICPSSERRKSLCRSGSFANIAKLSENDIRSGKIRSFHIPSSLGITVDRVLASDDDDDDDGVAPQKTIAIVAEASQDQRGRQGTQGEGTPRRRQQQQGKREIIVILPTPSPRGKVIVIVVVQRSEGGARPPHPQKTPRIPPSGVLAQPQDHRLQGEGRGRPARAHFHFGIVQRGRESQGGAGHVRGAGEDGERLFEREKGGRFGILREEEDAAGVREGELSIEGGAVERHCGYEQWCSRHIEACVRIGGKLLCSLIWQVRMILTHESTCGYIIM